MDISYATTNTILPVMADRKAHDAIFPHWVHRPRGANLWIIEYAASGHGSLFYPNGKPHEGQEYPLEPGSFLLFAPGAFQNYGMDPAHARWTHFYATFTPRDNWTGLLDWPQMYKGAFRLPTLPAEKRREFVAAFEHVVGALAHGTNRRDDFYLNYLENLLLRLDALNPLSASGRLDERIRTAMEQIRSRFTERLDIPTLAALCHLSPSRFSHLFRAEAGMTPLEYLEARRLENARQQLAMTALPVRQIARESGFECPFYFSRIFRRAFSLSPRAYRQQLQG